MYHRQLSAFAALGFTLAACETAPPIDEGPILTAASVVVETRAVNTTPLPDAWGDQLHVAQTPTGAMIGGASGLFQTLDGGLEMLDDVPVRGLTNYLDEVFVARDDGLFVWEDGEYALSPINDALPGLTVHAIATQGDRLWLGTDAGLVSYTSDALVSFTEVAPVHAVVAADGADYVVFEGGEDNGRFAMDVDGEAWNLLDFSGDAVESIVPGVGTQLYGLIEGQLVSRIDADAGFVWRGVAVDTTEPAAIATGIAALATHPTTATVWAITDEHFIEIDGSERTLVAHSGLSAGAFLVDNTGTLWRSDGATLTDLPGAETQVITWDAHIAPFATANCSRCHGELSTATEMFTAEHWRTSIDDIIDALTTGSMPADGAALEDGNLGLVQAWKEGGLQ